MCWNISPLQLEKIKGSKKRIRVITGTAVGKDECFKIGNRKMGNE